MDVESACVYISSVQGVCVWGITFWLEVIVGLQLAFFRAMVPFP